MTDPHLDDEQLSLLLDGVDVDGRAHVDAGECARCADRLAALRGARDLVADSSVPPLPADVLDRLVATALDAPAVADVVPLSAAPSRRRLLAPPPAWLLGAAAGIAALVGVAGLLQATDMGSGDDAGSLANMTAADESSGEEGGEADASKEFSGSGTGGAAPGAAAASAPFDPEVVTLDLADQDDPAALAAALGNVTTITGSPTAAFSARESAADASAESEDSLTRAAPPATTGPVDRAQCRAAADSIGAGRFAGLLSTATVRWKGEAAEVLVFRLAEPSTDEPPLTRQALVLARPGCRLLADPRF